VHEAVQLGITAYWADLIIQTKESRGPLRCILHLRFLRRAPPITGGTLPSFHWTEGPHLLTFRPIDDFGFPLSGGRRSRFRAMVVDLGLSTVVFLYY
jgi:hypothetical protein